MNPAQFILLALVRVYRWMVSPLSTALFGPAAGCRFTPTCSQYAAEAVRTHGAMAGSWLAARRICRCHPWGDCGHDPVPEKVSRSGFRVPGPEPVAAGRLSPRQLETRNEKLENSFHGS